MVMSPAQRQILLVGYEAQRTRLINDVRGVIGKLPVAGYLAHRNDVLTATDPWTGTVLTADAAMSGQVSQRGKGSLRAFNGSSNYLTRPDAANLSWGNGVTDQAFSGFVVVNVTDTAAFRTLFSKWVSAGNQVEYIFGVAADDTLIVFLTDVSHTGSRSSSAAITQGSLITLGFTYSGVAGASQMDGVTFYMNGVAIAATSTNTAAYVALQDLTADWRVGGHDSLASFQGQMGMSLMWAGAATAGQMASLHQAAARYWGF